MVLKAWARPASEKIHWQASGTPAPASQPVSTGSQLDQVGALPRLRLGGAERLPVVHDSGQQCAEQATLLRIQRPQQGVGGAGKSFGSVPRRSLSVPGQVG